MGTNIIFHKSKIFFHAFVSMVLLVQTSFASDFMGRIWTQIEVKRPPDVGERFSYLVTNNKIYILSQKLDYWEEILSDIWVSEDGIKWKELAREQKGLLWDMSLGVRGWDLWLWGGVYKQAGFSADDVNSSPVWKMSPGGFLIQVARQSPFELRSGANIAVLGGKTWMFGGYSSTSGRYQDLWKSSDLTSWKEVLKKAPFGSMGSYGLVGFRGELYWFGPERLSELSTWKSSDGVSWTRVGGFSTFGSGGETGVVSCGGRLFFHSDIKIWVSSGGSNWHVLTPPFGARKYSSDAPNIRTGFGCFKGELIRFGKGDGGQFEFWKSSG